MKDETSVVRGFDAVQSLLGGVGQRESPIRAWLVLFNWLKQAGISFNQWQQVTCLLIVSLYPLLPFILSSSPSNEAMKLIRRYRLVGL